MKYIVLILTCLLLASCQKVKVGYLETESIQYRPNVLEVVKTKDENDPKHLVSAPMDGLEGTQPIYVTIHSVRTEDGSTGNFIKEVTVRGNGSFDVPVRNDIAAGTYVVTLKVENEGHSAILEDIFTIVVKDDIE